ncbi:relaxase/mobilization nuclease domain-containing protein, partial [Aeromonas veronii]|uniref:relaxase/mobilization nuclease domain-containing protein n=2 Tax=Aeromonas TaxID=642 RepID=UPI001F4011C1
MEYLLGKDGNRDGATLDRGDPEMVKELIDGSHYAQRYTSGVLSFHEPDLPRETKERLMDEFEQALLPGLDADQYAVLWVEHRDKDRLELNFVVPNVELLSGKRLQPYFHGADGHRINAWRTAINGELGLHDPDDPINRQAVTTAKDLPRNKLEAEQAITGGLLGMAAAGLLKNREDVLKTLTG